MKIISRSAIAVFIFTINWIIFQRPRPIKRGEKCLVFPPRMRRKSGYSIF